MVNEVYKEIIWKVCIFDCSQFWTLVLLKCSLACGWVPVAQNSLKTRLNPT
jgi:hypothetical protein